jgi:hypothetical protein
MPRREAKDEVQYAVGAADRFTWRSIVVSRRSQARIATSAPS